VSTAALEESAAAPILRSEADGDETGDVPVGADLLAEVSGLATDGVLFAAGGIAGALPAPEGELVSGVSPLPRAESAAGVPVFVGSFIATKPTSVPDAGAPARSVAPGEFAAGVGVALPGVGEVAASDEAALGVLG
jgi:hypothetical protein